MSFLRQIVASNSKIPLPWYPAGEGAWVTGRTMAGENVSSETALKISAVWGCVRLLSETIASLPAIVYQRDGEGRQRATNHPLYDLLHDAPNDYQTAFEFFDIMTHCVIMRGNAYAKIVPGVRGFADQLQPIHPDFVTVQRLPDGSPRYLITDGDVLTEDQILHIKGYSPYGVVGQSVVSFARESFGLSLGAEHHGARFFGNNATPGGVLEMPVGQTLDKKAAKRLKSDWESATMGDNQHRTAILEDGMKWQQIGITNKDSQFLESREFQAEEVCRWFRVPAHMIQLTSKSTSWGTGIEEMGQGFVTYTLMPWLTRWEQALSRSLILAPQIYFVEFLLDALLRGKTKERYDAYAVAKQNGWMNGNEIRARENQNPMDNGADYWMPANYTVVGAAVPAPVVTPPPATAPAGELITDTEKPMQARFRQLVHEDAARIVRRERASLKRTDAPFGDEHAAFLSDALVMTPPQAQGYIDWRNEHRDVEFDADAIEKLADIVTGDA